MADPQAGDVLIRVQLNTLPTSYAVVDAQTEHVLGGPYRSLAEAALMAARYVRPMARIWRQHLDHRGLPDGPAQRFPVIRP
jgi:hypothetical protein